MEIWEDLAIMAWTELLLDSYEQLIGALDLWGLTWPELLATPSRATVEGEEIAQERQKMLDLVKKQGYINDYHGVRITKNGQLFRIEKAIVWNIIDRDGIYCGQAATFADWIFL
jgi:hypothetical protein